MAVRRRDDRVSHRDDRARDLVNPVDQSGGAVRRPMKGALPLLSRGTPPPSAPATVEPAIDPVCGMTVDPRTAAGSFVHRGRTYWFCSTGCLERFRADPERYLAGGPRGMPDAPAVAPGRSGAAHAARHTCPMHPEV